MRKKERERESQKKESELQWKSTFEKYLKALQQQQHQRDSISAALNLGYAISPPVPSKRQTTSEFRSKVLEILKMPRTECSWAHTSLSQQKQKLFPFGAIPIRYAIWASFFLLLTLENFVKFSVHLSWFYDLFFFLLSKLCCLNQVLTNFGTDRLSW